MPKRSPLTRIFAPLFIALIVLAGLFAAVTWMPLRSARDEWAHGRYADSIATAEQWAQTRMWPNQYHQILAVAYLSSKHAAAAQPHLQALQGKTLTLSV